MRNNAERPKGKLLMTRNDHLMIHSSPPISSEFGDDTILGDTLSDSELGERYVRDVTGMKMMMGMPEERRMDMFGDLIESFPSELAYYKSRGVDITEGLVLIGGEGNLPDINELRTIYDSGI